MGNNPSSQTGGHPRDKAQSPSVQQHYQSLPQRPAPSSAATRPPLPATPQGVAPPAASLAQATGSTTTHIAPMSLPAAHHTTAPVDMPASAVSGLPASRPPRYQPSIPTPDLMPLMSQNSMTEVSYLARPPRLPLRIEEEESTPGSPVMPPALGEPVSPFLDLDSDIPTAKSSSSNIEGEQTQKSRQLVATKLTWRHGGDRVYVTGTPFQWNRKLRMYPVPGKPGYFSVTVPMLVGTHHIRFLVDNKMRTANDMPTTVDYANTLVNYIVVVPENAVGRVSRSKTASTAPSTAPSTGAATPAPVVNAAPAEKQPPPPPRESSRPPRRMRQHALPAPEDYTVDIPRYLKDFDMPEDSEEYMYAVAAIEKLSSPPALPGFLGKPIMNGSASIKDDNSVLTLPNHSVLNHLATISIKNGVLGVCATTRYRHKYVTTIIYKPINPEEG
ncbi:hypothetical protein TD95_003115 [Thielaviopsis punctulata]|uniref:Association with the SNF1 complex (ASC) domain-containing protein n=1 Tax=Thielaviopsis punctulata TaxID=72032 RepID=A0A0F4ZFZ8_9PEZI|nr:hypothetical protein TD95_003115 [Thielaviopsis punctulata]